MEKKQRTKKHKLKGNNVNSTQKIAIIREI